jgi:lipoyl-dependent peroxiredoxin
MKRSARAHWQGDLKRGRGALTTESGALTDAGYSVPTRFGNERGTNSEELIAAAHAGCFSMALAYVLEQAGTPPVNIQASADLFFENQDARWTVTGVHLKVAAKVPGASEEAFQNLAEVAKRECLVSRLIKVEVTLDARLEA